MASLLDLDCYQLGPVHQLDLQGVKATIEAQAVIGIAGASPQSR